MPEGKKPEDKPAPQGMDYEKLNATLMGISNAIQASQSVNEKLIERVSRLEQGGSNPPPRQEEDKPYEIDLGDEQSLEKLSRHEFAKKMLDNFNSLLEHNMGKLSESLKGELGNVQQNVTRSQLESEVKELSNKNKDFWDWKDEIKQLRQDLPNASITRLYNLARAENPDKAKQLDEKYVEPASKDDSSSKSKDDKKFGGFFPSSQVTEESQNMKPDEAATKAWEDTFGGNVDLDSMMQQSDQP